MQNKILFSFYIYLHYLKLAETLFHFKKDLMFLKDSLLSWNILETASKDFGCMGFRMNIHSISGTECSSCLQFKIRDYT